MPTFSKLQPFLLKQSSKTESKSEKLEIMYQHQSMSVFLDIEKFTSFRWKNAHVSKTPGFCHLIHIFFGSTLGKV